MSIQDEQELRDRLSNLMGDLEPRPAPVVSAMHQGKGIRMRRWVSAAAGLAVLAAGAIAVPWLLSQRPPAPAAPKHYKVTVAQLGVKAKGGLIGEGTIDGKPWRILLDRSQGNGCITETRLLVCGPPTGGSAGARQVSLQSSVDNGTQYQVGTVGAGVSRVAIQLSDGSELDLHPVTAFGKRWVAVAVPQLTITKAVAFLGPQQYQYAIPFVNGISEAFVTWLNLGDPGLPRASRQLQAGTLDGVSWSTEIKYGPWGICGIDAGGSVCLGGTSELPALLDGQTSHDVFCMPLYNSSGHAVGASSGIEVVQSNVRYIVLKFADGSQRQLTTVSFGGAAAVGYALPDHPAVVTMLEFGWNRHFLHSTSGAGWTC